MALKRFLVTRSEAQGRDFAAALRACGHEAVLVPLASVQFMDVTLTDVQRFDLILVTSANGAAALARLTQERALPILAVGPQTATALVGAGFTDVSCADGDATALAARVPTLVSAGGWLLHITGKAGKSPALPGYELTRVVGYDMVRVPVLPDALATVLQSGTLTGAFFFSPGSAAHFRDLIVGAGLAETCAPLDAYCISQGAANVLSPLIFAHFYISAQPDRAALIAMLPPC